MHEEAARCVGQWSSDLVFGVVDEGVAPGEQFRGGVVFIRVKTERDGPVQRHTASWRYRSAVPPAERRVDQLGRFRRDHLRVHVHVFVRAPGQGLNGDTIHK